MSFTSYLVMQFIAMFSDTLFSIGDITFNFTDLLFLVCMLSATFALILVLASFARFWIEDRREQKRLDKAKEG